MMKENASAGPLSNLSPRLDAKLAGYLAAAGAMGMALAEEAQAVVVSNTTVQPFGINGTVNIDFNNDSQIDVQIDHDRVNLSGTNLDYLQIDKNDVNGEANPLAFDDFLPDLAPETFPLNGTNRNNDTAVLSFTNDFKDLGGYAVALKQGDVIGGSFTNPGNPTDPAWTGSFVPGTIWDWQEGNNFLGSGTFIRANRLIDEDAGQIDTNAGRAVTVPFGSQPVFPELDDFIGLNGEVRYLGVRVDLNDVAREGLNPNNPMTNPNFHQQHWYGWIGIRITNEADATGEVVGYAYESQLGMPIMAGDIGTPAGLPGDYNGNNVVDAADYTTWRDKLGQAIALPNEGASPGVVDAEDYTFWKSHFGMSLGSGGGASGVAVPEPGSLLMAAIGGAFFVLGGFVVRKLCAGSKK